jgi:hypothetical protein
MMKRAVELLNITGLLRMGEGYTKELAWVHTTEIIKTMSSANRNNYPGISLYKVDISYDT